MKRLWIAILVMLVFGCGSDDQEAPANNQPTNNQPTNNQPMNNQPMNNPPTNNQPTNNQPTNNQPTNNQPTNNQPTNNQPDPEWISAQHRGDVNIASHPAVVFYDGFEYGDVAALVAEYNDVKSNGLAFSDLTPPGSPGMQSVQMRAGGQFGAASDAFKRLGDGHDQLYVRYYVRHEDAPYHHSGVWIGGYNPPTNWPNPRAGTRPSGDDRLSVAIEPSGASTRGRRLDFYNYWMHQRSWRDPQPQDNTDYFGNAVLHDDGFYMRIGEWMCIEFMVRLNDDPGSAAGGELAVWHEDELLAHYTDQGPIGYWVRDKFCPADADAAACTDFAPQNREVEVLNLQWRNSQELNLNHIWIQNYISQGSGSMWFDDLVVATQRIGCIQP